ncbi:uncharacterized protein [Eurosta solidaginis]|uniref:uncharacterized protein n=1 Tax=Eurosta solidaginis TaxID=178769 RepID=UPI0035313E58
MGNLYSKVWSSKEKEPKVYITPLSKKGTVYTAVEDIQKLTTEQMEEQFENICRASHKMLQSLTHNPCGELSLRIKQCLDENVQQMSKCFAVMDDYRACVNNMMAEKLADVVSDLREPGESGANEYDIMRENELAEELERKLKRHVEEMKPKERREGRNGHEHQKQEQFKKKECHKE